MTNIKSYTFKIFTVFSFIFILSNCKDKNSMVSEASIENTAPNQLILSDSQLKNAAIVIDSMRIKTVNKIAKLNGNIEVMPEHRITISSPMAGIVKQIKWIPGAMVSKGQTLIRLENQEFVELQEAYLNAKNALSFSKIEYDRQIELSKNDANSAKVLQQAEEKWKAHSVAVKSLYERLSIIQIDASKLNQDNISSTIEICAPATGPITKVNVNTGKYIEPGTSIMEMIDPKGLKLVLRAFEKDLPFIHNGQTIKARTNSSSNEICHGKVESIVKSVENDGYSSIICQLDGCKGLVSGLYMNAEINLENHQTYVIPNEAIVSFEGKNYAFISLNSNTFELVEITIGEKEKLYSEISNYHNLAGKKIVINGAYTLLMAMKNVADE